MHMSGRMTGSFYQGPDGLSLNLLNLWRHPQKTWNPTPKILFHCKLEDSPNLLRVWTAL